MAPSRPVLPPLLARTSSLTSLASSTSSASSSSVASSPTTAQANAKRRTRKRITPQQLRMLEQLFERDTHPSREDRDALAAELGMESKSVTIWFQNKRQTARKIALHNATNMHNALGGSSSSKNSRSLSADAQPTVKTERSSSLYDSMPSSPYRVSSPQPADYFHGQRGSLDWACAKEMLSQQSVRTQLSGGETDEDESHEALTPRDPVDMDWTGNSAAISPQLLKKEHDEDVMKAALALCGLRG